MPEYNQYLVLWLGQALLADASAWQAGGGWRTHVRRMISATLSASGPIATIRSLKLPAPLPACAWASLGARARTLPLDHTGSPLTRFSFKFSSSDAGLGPVSGLPSW